MKTKILTICLLLFSSQVFAMDYQIRFENIVNSVRIKFDNSNEIIKRECKRDRDNQLKKLLPDKKIQKWQGIVNKILPDNDGDVFFTVKLPYSNTIIRNGYKGIYIKKNSKIYNVVRTLNEGDFVNFSGYFPSSSYSVNGVCCVSWHITELSVTRIYGMHEPEFAFVFENIARRGRLDDFKNFKDKVINNPYYTEEDLLVDPVKVDPVKIETLSDEEIYKEIKKEMVKKNLSKYVVEIKGISFLLFPFIFIAFLVGYTMYKGKK